MERKRSLTAYRLVSIGCLAFLLIPGAAEAQRGMPAMGTHGMVASAHPLASKVGVDILKKGGNAVDAAVATAFVLGVVEPYASGIGGGGFMLIYRAATKETIALDYREMAPLKASPNLYRNTAGGINWDELKVGHRSVAVPGAVAGLSLALEKYGTVDLAKILSPAIELAEGGYPVNSVFNGMMRTYGAKILRFQEAKRIFLQNGAPFKVGERIVLKDLAKTYREIAQKGPAVFYTGDIAEAIAAEMRKGNGLITQEDLAGYRPVFREPVRGTYREYEIFSMAPPSSGGTHVIQFLNILEGYPLSRMGQNSAASIRVMTESMKRIFSDWAKFMGDPDFVKVPLEKLLSKEYAAEIRKEIKFSDYLTRTLHAGDESDQTTHLSVADQQGNFVALTQTINSFFSSGVVVPGTGILLNNEMSDFDPFAGRPNSIQAKKRPISSMSPTLVLKDGKPFLSIGMPGAVRIISVLPQILVNIIDFQMNIQQAIDAPRIHFDSGEIWMEPRVSAQVQNELIGKGYKLNLKKSFDLWFGGAEGVMIVDGKYYGGADPRREGSAMGY